jgi:hypothetical protein
MGGYEPKLQDTNAAAHADAMRFHHRPDYDCAGGSGNGPLYTGPVTVVGPDEFDLDREGDGVGCEG